MTKNLRRLFLAGLVVWCGVQASPAHAQFGGSAARPAPAAPEAGDDALERVTGRIGFGWLGFSDIPLPSQENGTISAPLLGVRIWRDGAIGPFKAWGIDVGVGFNLQSGETNSVDDPSARAFFLQGGLPLVLASTRHMAVEVIPEIRLGLASSSEDIPGGGSIDFSGNVFEIGARAGTEVFFGFMGLPQLSLEASVGLFISHFSSEESAPGVPDVSSSQTSFSTRVFNQPWDIFRAGIAARYYF